MDNDENTEVIDEYSEIPADNEVPSEIKHENKNKDSKNKKLLIIVIVVMFLLISTALAYFFLNNNSDNVEDLSNGNYDDQNDDQAVVCSKDGLGYEVGAKIETDESCQDCTCGEDGMFDCVVNEACQSAKDNEEFFKNKVFYASTRGFEENNDQNMSATKYEVYSYDVGTKQKKQLTYMNKDKTLKDMYSYNIRGVSSNKDMILLRNYRIGDEFKTDAIKLNIETLKWEMIQNYKNAENSSTVSFLNDGSFSYLNFVDLEPNKATMFVNSYRDGATSELVKKPGFFMYGRGGSLEDMSVLRYSPNRERFLVKNTFYTFGEDMQAGISFMNPIWGYDKDGTEEISILGTQPSWLSDDKFVFIESEDVSDSSADVSLSVYDYQNSNASELLSFDKFPYGVDALSNKVLYWNFESSSQGVTESETLLYDLETEKTISLGDDFNQSKWLNENIVVMRKAADCEEIYNSGNYNAECPGMYDGTTLIDLNTIWTYDLTTNKATEFILTDEGDAIYDYFSFASFK